MALVVSSRSSAAQPTAPLTQAQQDFERSLTAKQMEYYGKSCIEPDTSSVLTFVAQIDEQNNGRGGRCFAPRLCSFPESTEQFVGVVNTFVSSNPTIAALVWGGVETAILAASNVASYFERITSMIMTVGKSCPTLPKFGLLYPASVELQTALCE